MSAERSPRSSSANTTACRRTAWCCGAREGLSSSVHRRTTCTSPIRRILIPATARTTCRCVNKASRWDTPLACDTSFRRQPWFEVPCCPTTAVRFFPSIGRYAYNQSPEGIWVNLYIGGQGTATLHDGARMTVRQSTSYPWEGRVQLQVILDRPQDAALHVRVPGWASASHFAVNGKAVTPEISKGYAHFRRRWAEGD